MATRKTMPAHLKRKLVDEGTMTERGLTMTPKPRRCRACGAKCWAAMADIGPSQGVYVRFEPTTTFGEYLARSAGIKTYVVANGRLSLRGPYSIMESSADMVNVHPEHLCNGPPLAKNPRYRTRFPGDKYSYPEIPPF